MGKISRLVIGAVQSGSGKTTIVTGLLAALRQRGLNVQSFKVGPDYIDPGYHQLASGRPAHNLDTWLVPPQVVPEIFCKEAGLADLAVIEGVMGLFDGGRSGVSSTAEIAKLIQAPVVLVIDVKSMGASAAAIARGFRDYDPDVQLAGVILNRVGSDTHEAIVREAMQKIGMTVFGAIRRDTALVMPERHLGLLPVQENEECQVVNRMGEAVSRQLDLDGLLDLAAQAGSIGDGLKAEKKGRPHLCRIGIARDEAFSFYYPTSLQVLEQNGAELVPFSPLHDDTLPELDGMIFGGGFPEMFAGRLAENASMRAAIRSVADRGMPIYAECGGYMYLLEDLQDFEGKVWPMAGVFSGRAVMTKKLQMVGYVEAELRQDTVLGPCGKLFHGHEFHFSAEQETNGMLRPFCFKKLRNGVSYPAGQSRKNALGSYLHLHFAGCPDAAASFVAHCRQFWLQRERNEGSF